MLEKHKEIKFLNLASGISQELLMSMLLGLILVLAVLLVPSGIAPQIAKFRKRYMDRLFRQRSGRRRRKLGGSGNGRESS